MADFYPSEDSKDAGFGGLGADDLVKSKVLLFYHFL